MLGVENQTYFHYKNMPMEYTDFSYICKNHMFFSLMFAQNIDLDNIKKDCVSINSPVLLYKMGFKGLYFSWTCFLDVHGLTSCFALSI